MSKWFRPTEKDIKDIINMYQSGLGKKPIAKKYHCSTKKIKDILENRGVEMHIKGSVSPYTFNEHFLDELDSPEKLYFLGWVYSDGCIDKDENLTKIGLSPKDIEILQKLNDLVESDREISIDEDIATLSLTSKHFKERLGELGCMPNKSLIIKWPHFIPDKYLKDFIRGYYDGDGSISIRQSKNGTYNGMLSVVGTYDFCSNLKDKLKKLLNITTFNIETYSNGITTNLTLNYQDDVLKFLNWMYEDTTIQLERKYQKYLTLKNSRSGDFYNKSAIHKRMKEKRTEILERHKNGESCGSIARDLNVAKSTICRIVKKFQDGA